MTGRELHDLTQGYWESRTGIGPILFLSAGLAALTGFLTVLLTFYLLTVQKLPVFAAMKALGASAGEIAALMALQAGLVFAAGAALAAVAVALTLGALGRTHISVVITTDTWLTVFGIIALACALACLPSVWKIRRLEPAEAFRA
jgi:putative ABC transport system permease protein